MEFQQGSCHYPSLFPFSEFGLLLAYLKAIWKVKCNLLFEVRFSNLVLPSEFDRNYICDLEEKFWNFCVPQLSVSGNDQSFSMEKHRDNLDQTSVTTILLKLNS